MSLSPPFDLINTGGSASLLDYNSGYTDGIDYGSVGIDYS
jgi:hypothetical protein